MKIILFGTGDYYQRFKRWFEGQEIVALIDNSIEKQGTFIDGIEVFSPQKIVESEIKFDFIFILSFYFFDMKKQLLQLGINEKIIYHFSDIHNIPELCNKKRPIYSWNIVENNDENKKRILLLSNDLEFSGPAIALWNAAIILKKNGYEVVFASILDGKLREKLLSVGIGVIVDENLQVTTMKNISWICKFDLIVCNTISFYVFLRERIENIPVIWWLHDSEFFYSGIDVKELREIDTKNMNIVSVGKVPKTAMQKYVPNIKINTLLYGVKDCDKKG